MGREPTEARYRLAPQMREYDGLRQVWHPYVMNFHRPDHASEVVCTDGRGFRLSARGGRAVGNFDGAPGPRGLVVGGSVAFGVGATADARTIPSLLNERSGLTWLNFGGMAISSTQELLLFLFHQADLGDVRRVVFFSGVNELVMALLGVRPAAGYGPIFNLASYEGRMNGARLSAPRKLVKAVLEPVTGPRTDWADATLRELVFERSGAPARDGARAPADAASADYAVAQYRRNLSAWRRLCAPHGIELAFVLQPVASWLERRAAPEEGELFDELDRRPSNTWRTLRERFDADQMRAYSAALAAICAEEGIAFHDANEAFGAREHDGAWLFVDRVHTTDRGNEVAAAFLAERGLA